MKNLEIVNELIKRGKAKDVQVAVLEALAAGVSAADILNKYDKQFRSYFLCML